MSLRRATNDKFKECSFDPINGNGTWRQQTAASTSKAFPVWPVRPKPYPSNAQSLSALENPENSHFDPLRSSGEARP